MDQRSKSAQQPRTMEVLKPRSSKAQTKCPPPRKKRLEKVSPHHTMTSSFTAVRENKRLDEEMKERLELLAGNPLKSSLKSDHGIQGMLDQRRETQQRLEALLKSTRSMPDIHAVSDDDDELTESLASLKESLQSASRMQAEVTAREKKAKEIGRFISYLKTQTDREGTPVVEFPDNFEEIVETAIASDKLPGGNEIRWIEFYEKKRRDPLYQANMKRIKDLDRQLAEKSANQSSHDQSVFVTGVKSASNKSQTSTQRTKPASPDKIQRNIEVAGYYKGHYSLIDRLGRKDKARLEALVDGNLIQECDGLVSKEESAQLKAIDEHLQAILPAIEWEKLSCTDVSTAAQTEPKEEAVREEKERRETYEAIKHINSELIKLQRQPARDLTEAEIEALVAETPGPAPARPAIAYYGDSLLEKAKDLVVRIEKVQELKPERLRPLYEDLEQAELEYYEELQIVQDVIAKSDGFIKTQSMLDGAEQFCENSHREVASALEKLSSLNFQLAQTLEVEPSDKEPGPWRFPSSRETLEDLDREIEAKMMETYVPPTADFSCLDDITPENFPKLYHVYERLVNNMPDDF